MFLQGIFRVLLGFLKISFLSGAILQTYMTERFAGVTAAGADFGLGASHLYIWLHFLNVYMNFSGYTDVAVGTGGMFGLRIRENFRFPLLARNIQEFWQRWHLSLADFVFRYLFVDLARRTKRVELSIFLSFVIVGLWHKLNLNYLVWGVCHGLGLAAMARYKQAARKNPRLSRVYNSLPHTAVSWYLTITYVAWLSAFANADGINAAWVLTLRLCGL